MRVVKHLFRGYAVVYAWFWSIVLLVLALLMVSLNVFGVWLVEADQASAWHLAGSQAPLWFLFVIGIMVATASLPVMVANGVTRREYSVGAGIFAVGSAVLFGLLTLAGYGIEYLVFRITGVLGELDKAYPWPTPGSAARAVLAQLAFMLAGWLIGMCFYRLKAWWAIAVTPVAALPMAVGVQLPDTTDVSDDVWLSLLLVGLGALVGYLLARTTPIRPKKA